MRDDETLPTFASNRDRIVFLLGEYKIPITTTALAGGVWAAWASPQIPSPPPSSGPFALAWLLLSFPAFVVAAKFVGWLFSPDYVKVGVCKPGEEVIYDGWKVPPEIWAEASVVGARPLEADSGMFDYVVTAFEFYDDLGELEVRGCERSDMQPSEALENATRVDEYYEHMHDVRRRYARLKATVARTATEIHDSAVMGMVEERERADLIPGVSITEELDRAADEADEVPDGPGPMDDDPQHVRRHGLDRFDGELPPRGDGVEVPVDD